MNMIGLTDGSPFENKIIAKYFNSVLDQYI